MKFIVAEKTTSQGIILVVTDKDILGKKYEEGNRQLDLANKFYLGEEKDAEYVKKILEDAYVVQFTGKNAVALGLSLDLVGGYKVVIISGIPHAEVLIDKN